MKQVVFTKKAPAAIGPYSQGIKAGRTVYSSGQLPVDPATGGMPDGIRAQADQSLRNVKAVLEQAGAAMEDVVKTTVFLADMEDFAAVNEVYGQYFAGECPARSCVQVARLPKDARIEVEAIAVIAD